MQLSALIGLLLLVLAARLVMEGSFTIGKGARVKLIMRGTDPFMFWVVAVGGHVVVALFFFYMAFRAWRGVS
jgi:hypothetical protein